MVAFHIIKNRNPNRDRVGSWPNIKPLGGANGLSAMSDEIERQREDIARTFATFKKDGAA